MTDIVDRLRIRRNPMLDGEREEAADEIERLQKAIAEERTACMRIALSFERDYGREVGLMARRIAEVIRRRGD